MKQQDLPKYQIIEIDLFKIPGDPDALTVIEENLLKKDADKKLKLFEKNNDPDFTAFYIREQE